MHGQKLSQPPPQATGFLNGTDASSFFVTTQNLSLTIGLSYVPAETRRFAPVETVVQPGVVIWDAAPLAGGGIHFTFHVPEGTAYAVEASPNLRSWHTHATGVGQIGDVTYTDAAGTNVMQYYRIKY